MKSSIIKISVLGLGLLLTGCFSSRDLEYDYEYDEFHEEVVIIEFVPVPSPPVYINPVNPSPRLPVVEKPRTKHRTNGEVSRRQSQNRRGTSYQSRDSNKNIINRNDVSRSSRNSVDKRTRKRR